MPPELRLGWGVQSCTALLPSPASARPTQTCAAPSAGVHAVRQLSPFHSSWWVCSVRHGHRQGHSRIVGGQVEQQAEGLPAQTAQTANCRTTPQRACGQGLCVARSAAQGRAKLDACSPRSSMSAQACRPGAACSLAPQALGRALQAHLGQCGPRQALLPARPRRLQAQLAAPTWTGQVSSVAGPRPGPPWRLAVPARGSVCLRAVAVNIQAGHPPCGRYLQAACSRPCRAPVGYAARVDHAAHRGTALRLDRAQSSACQRAAWRCARTRARAGHPSAARRTTPGPCCAWGER